MLNFGSTEWLVLIAAVAGAIHVVAPDHWIPVSMLSWQGGWRAGRIAFFSTLILLLHTLLGFAIYQVLRAIFGDVNAQTFFLAALVLVLAMAAIRWVRFSRRREVIRLGSRPGWGMLTVISLLGPAEAAVPVFVKGRELGVGYLAPFAAFFGGTLLTGVLLVFLGRMIWNRPPLLTRGLSWAHHRLSVLSVIAGVTLGLAALFQVG